jgi:hypothetical protein
MTEIPNTLNYMVAGFLVVIIGTLIYIGSLIVRWKKYSKLKVELKNLLDHSKKQQKGN